MIPPASKLRLARPTSDMAAARRFYVDGLGLAVLGSFENHQGFDGMMLGFTGSTAHLEITRDRAGGPLPPPSPEDLIVFYIEARGAWDDAVQRMVAAGFPPVPSSNPYWDIDGATFADADGFRLVLQNARSRY